MFCSLGNCCQLGKLSLREGLVLPGNGGVEAHLLCSCSVPCGCSRSCLGVSLGDACLSVGVWGLCAGSGGGDGRGIPLGGSGSAEPVVLSSQALEIRQLPPQGPDLGTPQGP